MYLYFDANGVLKELINDEFLRQAGSPSNKIYVYIEGAEFDKEKQCFLFPHEFVEGFITYLLPDGTTTNTLDVPVVYQGETATVKAQEIPYCKRRDLKFFKYHVNYELLEIDIPVDNIDELNVLSQKGLVSATLSLLTSDMRGFISSQITFEVERSVVNVDNKITLSQWSYLLKRTVRQSEVTNIDNRLTNHIANKDNPHEVTAEQVGLGNVDNTSDADKPISDATQTELDRIDDDLDRLDGLVADNAADIIELNNRKANLGADGKILADELPGYVDDITILESAITANLSNITFEQESVTLTQQQFQALYTDFSSFSELYAHGDEYGYVLGYVVAQPSMMTSSMLLKVSKVDSNYVLTKQSNTEIDKVLQTSIILCHANNRTYRWAYFLKPSGIFGSLKIELEGSIPLFVSVGGGGVGLGYTHQTAFYGDEGKEVYDNAARKNQANTFTQPQKIANKVDITGSIENYDLSLINRGSYASIVLGGDTKFDIGSNITSYVDLVPTGNKNLGSTESKWQHLYLSGTAYLDHIFGSALTLNTNSGLITTNSHFRPTNAAQDLGNNDQKWRDIYLSGSAHFDGETYTSYIKNEGNRLRFYYGGAERFRFGNAEVVTNLPVYINNDSDNGMRFVSNENFSGYIDATDDAGSSYVNVAYFTTSNWYFGPVDVNISQNLKIDGRIDFKHSLAPDATWTIQASQWDGLFVDRNNAHLYVFEGQRFAPTSNNVRDLGSSDVKWKNLYLSGGTHYASTGTNHYEITSGDAWLNFKFNNTNIARMYVDNFSPSISTADVDLGNNDYRWHNLYLNGEAHFKGTTTDYSITNYNNTLAFYSGTNRLVTMSSTNFSPFGINRDLGQPGSNNSVKWRSLYLYNSLAIGQTSLNETELQAIKNLVGEDGEGAVSESRVNELITAAIGNAINGDY